MFLVAKCDCCDYNRWLVPQPSYYKVGRKTVIISTTSAWCDSCAAVTFVENLKTAEEWERRLEEARALTDEGWLALYRFGPDAAEWLNVREMREEGILEAERTLAWRRKRRSPPKCLECGSTRFQPSALTREDDDVYHIVTHPGCGGTIRIGGGGFAQSANYFYYTPEGERIGGYGWDAR